MKNLINWEIPDNKISKYYKAHISINSAYKWGRGWNASEKQEFENVVYPALMDAGYDIVHSKSSGVCPSLYLKEDSCHLFNQVGYMCDNKKIPSLYLHPMEFTGYIPKEDAEKIVSILNDKCKSVCSAELTYCKPVYDMSDEEYASLIVKHSKEIVDFALKEGNDLFIKYPSELGFEFAKNCRIPRIGDLTGGYTCSDTDVKTVEAIVTIAKNLGYFSKENTKTPELSDEEQDYER